MNLTVNELLIANLREIVVCSKRVPSDAGPPRNCYHGLRKTSHRPWIFRFIIAAGILFPQFLLSFVLVVNLRGDEPANHPAVFDGLPKNGIRVARETIAPARNRNVVARRLGGQIDFLSETVVTDGKHDLRINLIRGINQVESDKIHRALLGMKQNSRHVCRNGNVISELMVQTAEQAALANAIRYQIPLLPKSARYRVRFSVAPVAKSDYSVWNKLFNLFLIRERGEDRVKIEQEIKSLSAGFEFGGSITVKRTGLGTLDTKWSFSPPPESQADSTSGDVLALGFANLPAQAGLPVIEVEAIVTTTSGATVPLRDPKQKTEFVKANEHWPADDAAVKRLSAAIVADAANDREKMRALLAWIGNPANLRYDGATGSRYGTRTVLKQRFGHCWDYSDVLITLCRAAGVPSRQVLGWLHHGEGHVWAEVLIDDQWIQVDPTTSQACGSDYIPLFLNEDGKMRSIYVSSVNIELVDSK